MKSSAHVVIGAGFGDEGKGRLTDFYASRMEDALVVRFNGGAQAGHTVVTPDGRRHVFSHFGSGSFAGARTFLSQFFAVNPLVFFKERKRLDELGVETDVMIDRRAPITTPYDMLVNQIAETARGAARHGSCGLGLGETVERTLNPQYALTMDDLIGRHAHIQARLARRLADIRTSWVPQRLATLGVTSVERREDLAHLVKLLNDPTLEERWIEDVVRFAESVTISDASPVRLAARRHAVVFEGAQGLLLDQDRGWFPYVTRSNTGLKNVLHIAAEADITGLNVTYVSRAYVTRHGEGPLPNALAEKPYAGIEDLTNVPNAYQGTLRFAHLDLDLLASTIAADLGDAAGAIELQTTLAMTCLDQTPDDIVYVSDGRTTSADEETLLRHTLCKTGLEGLITSHGVSRDATSLRSDIAA